MNEDNKAPTIDVKLTIQEANDVVFAMQVEAERYEKELQAAKFSGMKHEAELYGMRMERARRVFRRLEDALYFEATY